MSQSYGYTLEQSRQAMAAYNNHGSEYVEAYCLIEAEVQAALGSTTMPETQIQEALEAIGKRCDYGFAEEIAIYGRHVAVIEAEVDRLLESDTAFEDGWTKHISK